MLVMAFVGLCASAQSAGDMAVGVNIGFAPCLESNADLTNFGLGAKFQYNVTDPIRLEADMEYWFRAKSIDQFDITVNGHYLFNVAEGFRVYPLVGLGYAHVASHFGSYSASIDKFVFNVGVGCDYDVAENLAISAEIKLQYIQDFTRLPIQFGVAYKF